MVLTVICGVLYTAVMTGFAQLVFPAQANGSIVTATAENGTPPDYGSALLGQNFTESKYLIGRPMQVSNLSPKSERQKQLVQQRVAWWHEFDPNTRDKDIPADLVTASGSGVDPCISPAAAEFQVARIAAARGMTPSAVRAIIQKYTAGRFLGFVGEPAVNVLQVNLALDGLM